MITPRYLSFSVNRKFGVEIEVTNHIEKNKLKSFVQAVDANHKCLVSNANDKDYGNNYWKIKHDGSCGDQDHKAGSEISSFVGNNNHDIAVIGEVVDKLKAESVRVNDNCAVHVHVEVGDFSRKQLAKSVAYWMKLEPILLQMVPKRRTKSIYCVPLRKFYKDMKLDSLRYDAISFWTRVRPDEHNDENRRVTYNICNICSYLNSKDSYYYDYDGYGNLPKQKDRKTVELRLPESTTDSRQVINWIKFFVRFVNIVKHKFSPTDLKSFDLEETLRFLGLHGTQEAPVILSTGLWKLKVWFLQRIVEFASKAALGQEAEKILEYISSPGESVQGDKTVRKGDSSGKYNDGVGVLPILKPGQFDAVVLG